MAEKKRRIHHLAKDLMVKSATIIEKCKAEGIEIKNHMHVVSAGLEATVREWFSEGAHSTTLEESQRIDLSSVRVKAKKKKKTKIGVGVEEIADGETMETATAVLEAPVADQEASAATSAIVEAAREEVEAGATVEERAEALATSAAVEAEAPSPEALAPEVPEEGSPAPQDEAEATEEAPVTVAGPQNVPQPAQLMGPKVVRIDRTEPIERPRPAARASSRPPRELAPPVPDEEPVIDEPQRGGRGQPKRSHSHGELVGRRGHPRRGPRDNRQATTEQLREWRERDVLEMREKIAAASGRGIGGLRAIERKSPSRMQGGIARRALKKEKVKLNEPVLIKDLSRETGVQVGIIVKRVLEEHDKFVTINSSIGTDLAQLIAAEFGIELVVVKAKTGLQKLEDEFASYDRKCSVPRPPVVAVLGHVDHGKTSLLDRIRKTNVTATESGGITQHVGAYRVRTDDKWVAFLDTPGHAAFTAMRARGANATDVVVLVVAADDGVMPTTVEAINHARAANATIVVALNKIDLDHDVHKLYGQLAEQGLTPSGDWGGETDVIKTSATTGEGIDELLSHLATLGEVLELKADPTIPATGTVLEAERSERIGPVARVLVQEGTLRTGQVIVCGAAYGRVRSMKDDAGRSVKEAGASTPVEVAGLGEVPEAGEKFFVVGSVRRAKEFAEEEAARRREEDLVRVEKPTTLESVFASAEEGEIPELNVIVRADVQGSIDALRQELAAFPDEEVKLNVMHAGVGTVTESDLALAKASESVIIAFHVVPEPAIQKKGEREGIDIRTYRVIYDVIDDVKKALEGLLAPEEKLESRGRAEVREVFSISKVGKAAGCLVREGLINRNFLIRLVRDGVVIRDMGELQSLRRFKDDVKEVRSGLECGIKIAGFDDVKPGDVIEAFEVVKLARTLQPAT